MTDQKKQKTIDLGGKVVAIIDGLLSAGDWDSSPFLKTASSRIRDLRDKLEKACSANFKDDVGVDEGVKKVEEDTSEGHLKVFVLLYQVDGGNLQKWFSAVRTLGEFIANKPAYKDEAHVKEVVRSKVSNLESNGYVGVNIRDTDLYQSDNQVDQFGHQLFSLKEGAIKVENIVEFVHANRKRYTLGENELNFLGEF